MTPHFEGTFEDLQNLTSSFSGAWRNEGNGKHVFRTSTGGVLNYWPKKGTVQVQGKGPDIDKLKNIFDDYISFSSNSPTKNSVPYQQEKSTKKIFIVHGHDTVARDQLELALLRLNLQPYVLMNHSASGQTLIEALEGHIGKDYSSAFGIVLMTPDDRGYAIKDGEGKIEPRARQNVILETGMLLSSLTRKRMALIVKGYLEIPSDLEGIIRLGYNEHIREIIPKLAQSLRSAGFAITPEAISAATC